MAVQVSRHPAAPPRLCPGVQAPRHCPILFAWADGVTQIPGAARGALGEGRGAAQWRVFPCTGTDTACVLLRATMAGLCAPGSALPPSVNQLQLWTCSEPQLRIFSGVFVA